MTNKEKVRFRQSKTWKDFVERELKTRGLECELFGTKLNKRTAQLHHLDPENYTDLDPTKFKLLSPTAHTLVEFVALLVHGNKTVVPRLDLLMSWIGPFLPKPERTVEKYYRMLKDSVAKPEDLG